MAIEIEKTQKFINKLVNIGLSILEMGKSVMNEFWYDFVEPKYEGKAKLMLHGYIKFYTLHKNGRHPHKYCKRS